MLVLRDSRLFVNHIHINFCFKPAQHAGFFSNTIKIVVSPRIELGSKV